MPRRPNPTPPRPQRRWASIPQTAEHLNKSERTVREMLADGRLKGYRQADPNRRSGRSYMVFIDLNEVDDAMVPANEVDQ
jgi:hypothetical protein